MGASVAAFFFALIKAIPAAEAIFAQLLDLYGEWKRKQNNESQKLKDARNAAAVAAALSGAPVLCSSCPFSAHNGAGQHGGADLGPAVPGNGPGGS